MRSSWLLFCVMAVAPALFADVAAIRDLIRGGRFAEAAAACEVELKKAPGNAALWTLRGFALRGTGDPAAAITALRRALALAPQYAPALQAAGQIEFERRDRRAASTLEAILRLDPGNATAHAMLGELAFEAADCAGALPHFAKVEKTPLVRWRQGVCLFQTERWSAAASEFAALLQLREHEATRFNLALSHWRAGDSAAALEALGTLHDADATSLRAAALRARKQVPRALEVLQEAVRRYPRDERLLQELALQLLPLVQTLAAA